MTRKPALALLMLLLATTTFAKGRAVAPPANGDADGRNLTTGASNVAGVVVGVSGNMITLADGLVVLDATNAKILGARGAEAGIEAIQRGTIVYAMVSTTDVAPNAPLPATVIAVVQIPDVTLFGPVQSIDRAARTFTVLGKTIRITDETSFGGFIGHRDSLPTLDDLQPNMLVNVTADAVNGTLVATTVMMIAPIPARPNFIRGTVQSIGADSWIVQSDGRSVTLVVNANTKIVGSPKVGDTVEVIYNVDSSNANVAISIIKHVELVVFQATVKSIGANAWVVNRRDGDVTVKITSDTRTMPGIVVGDTVEVIAREEQDGTITALSILKHIQAPKVATFRGVVKSIASDAWVVTRDDDHLDVTVKLPTTIRLFPSVGPGARVEITAFDNRDGTYTMIAAREIR